MEVQILKVLFKKIKDEDISAIGLTNYFNFTDDDFNLKQDLKRTVL